MADEYMLIFDENGVAHEYDPTFDVTVHCKSEQESEHILDLLNTGKRMQWISVKDELPDRSCEVLAYVIEKGYEVGDGGDIQIVRYDSAGYWCDWDGYVVRYEQDCGVLNRTDPFGDVAYWMPLPEPPEEGIK